MKNGNRWTQACLALLVNACLGTPSTAQGLAAQSAKIAELERAGKYAEAIPLAQAMLANREKGPPSRDLAGALNNLTQPYGDVGRDADARAPPQARSCNHGETRCRDGKAGPGAIVG
jgi:hypothetical protein